MSLRIPQRWPITVSNPPAERRIEKQPRPHPLFRTVKDHVRLDPDIKSKFDLCLKKGVVVDIYA
jgi:hypothetical protein